MIYKTFDIVLVPFPFCDCPEHKKRPALVVSSTLRFNATCNHTIMAMITSASHTPWPFDTCINDMAKAGLSKKSVVRMKLFTVSSEFIIRKLGELGVADQKSVAMGIKTIFNDVVRQSL